MRWGFLLAEVFIYSRIRGNRKGLKCCRALWGSTIPPPKPSDTKPQQFWSRDNASGEHVIVNTTMSWSPSQPLWLEQGKKVSRFQSMARGWCILGQVGWSSGGTRAGGWNLLSVRPIPTQTIPGLYGTGYLGGWAVGAAWLLTPMKVPPMPTGPWENALESLSWPSASIRAAGEFLASQLGAWKGLLSFHCFGKLLLQKKNWIALG